MQTVIEVPDDGLYTQWQWAQVTLVHYGSNKLRKQDGEQTALKKI